MRSIEWSAVAIILYLFLALQWNAVSKGNYAAQDYQRHHGMIELSAHDPWKALTTPSGYGTPCSLYQIIGGRVYNLLGKEQAFLGIAVINCIVNTFGLFLFYLLIRKTINSQILRLSCLLFITFLPVTVITSAVIAADAFTALLFITVIWGMIVITEKLNQGKKCPGWMVMEGMLLILIFTIKFHYAVCIGGIFLIGIILKQCRLLEKSKLGPAFVILILIPVLALVLCYFSFIRYQLTDFFGQAPNPNAPRMSVQSFMLKKEDLSLLQAPFFRQEKAEDGQKIVPLSESNSYYYPLMLHVAVFTDLFNIYQPIRLAIDAPQVHDDYDTRIRPKVNQDRMRLAVHTGLLFSFAFVVSMFWLVCKFLHLIWRKSLKLQDCYILIPLILSLTLFLFTVSTFPKLFRIWNQGIWLPRYILPAVLSFGVFLFIGLEKLFYRCKWALWAVALITLFQTCLHISFLWIVL